MVAVVTIDSRRIRSEVLIESHVFSRGGVDERSTDSQAMCGEETSL